MFIQKVAGDYPGHNLVREGAFPILEIKHGAVAERGGEVVRPLPDLEDVAWGVGPEEIPLRGDRFPIYEKLHFLGLRTHYGDLLPAVIDRSSSIDGPEPSNVVDELGSTDQKGFPPSRPGSAWGAVGEDRSLAGGLELGPDCEVDVESGLNRLLRLRARGKNLRLPAVENRLDGKVARERVRESLCFPFGKDTACPLERSNLESAFAS